MAPRPELAPVSTPADSEPPESGERTSSALDSRRVVIRGLERLRNGVWCIFGLRALVGATGAAALTFALSAWAVGPVASVGLAIGVWVTVALGAGAGAWWGWRPAARYGRGGVSRLLGAVDPRLVSATRSVVELANERSDLAEAHAARVAGALSGLELRRLWPWRRLRSWGILLALLAMGAATAITLLGDRARSGAYALTHPGARAPEGTRVASVVASTRARLRFPAYMDREDLAIGDVDRLEAPRGTAVQLGFRPRVAIASATLITPEQRSVFEKDEEGWWSAPLVVRDSGPLIVEVVDPSGRTLRDAAHRVIVAEVDEPPAVTLTQPKEDLEVELDESVALSFEASDAIGVTTIELCIRTPGGEVERRRLQAFPEPVPFHRGHTRVAPVELGARPGDSLTFWIEALDSDDVSGPNVGRSVERNLRIASEATRREAFAGDLSALLDAALGTLADRLERPVPEATDDARARDEALAPGTQRYLEGLAQITAADHESFDPSVLAAMRRKAGRARAREHRALDQGATARREVDVAIVALLEDQALFLADLLGRARLQDAAALARELEALRREMRSLLSELRRTQSPEAREALMAALARARARLQELEQRIASMGEAVPQEFLNTDSMSTPAARDALADLSGALEANDLDAAERALTALEQEIDALAKSLGQAGEAYAEARFGPRQAAMAEALDRLAGLEAEQRQLAERTQRVRREAAERARGAAGSEAQEAARDVAARAREAADALEQLPRGVLSPTDEENLDRARQRLSDTAAALETGDLGEARRMASEAERDADRLARDLEVSALMFSGREGRTAEAAQRARRASDQVRGLGRSLDEALPRIGDFVEAAQGRQMRADADRQGLAREVAGTLGEAFAGEPDGAPLSPEGAEVMERVAENMGSAREALGRGDPLGASRSQEEAARELTELREKLEQQSQSQSGGGGGEGGQAPPDPRRRVQIPESHDDAEAARRRRRILDAMRERAPEGYEDAVRRYYEELLR